MTKRFVLFLALFGCSGAIEATPIESGVWIQCEYAENGALDARVGRVVEVEGERVKLTPTSHTFSSFAGTVSAEDGALRATARNAVLRGTVDSSGTRFTGHLDLVDDKGRTKSSKREVFFKNDDRKSCP